MSDDVIQRRSDGTFLPGKAPNPAGRPKGLSRAEKMFALLAPERDNLVAKTIELALAGDVHMMRLCWERLGPALKQESEMVSCPGLAEAATLTDKCHAIMSAVGRGEISAEAGERLLRMIDVYRKATAVDELERRIAALEGKTPRVIEPDDCSDIT